jgi:putative DNA primase/helicase
MTNLIIANQLQDKREAKSFLGLLDPCADFFTFQTFDNNNNRKDYSLVKVIHGSLDKCWDELVELNQKGAGIFVTVNETDGVGRKNCNIIRARAIFQDDDGGFEGTYPLTPSIEVASSPGKYQRYWLSSGLTPDLFNTLLDRLVQSYGSDKNAKGLARVFRLPGFLHLKDPAHPHLVTLLEPSPGTVYGAEELISAFLGDDNESSGDVERFDAGNDAKEACSSLPEKCTGVPSESEKERIVSALQALPQRFVDERSLWRDIGMALHSTGLPDARPLFDEWSMGSEKCGGVHAFVGSAKYDKAGQDTLWTSLRQDYTGPKITIKTLFYHARQNGWIDPERNYHHTDLGNAKRLVDRHGLNLRYVVEWGKWLIWQDGRWQVDSNFQVVRLAKETIEALWYEARKLASDEARTQLRKHAMKSESAASISAMISLARSEKGIAISAGQLDSNPHLLGVQNGVIDLDTLTFREARREDYVTKFCGAHYDPDANCPNWRQFLNTIMDGNQDVIDYLQRFDGYGLTGGVSEEVFRILWGNGKNGKSTYRETKRTLLGDYSDTCGVDVLLQRHHAGSATPQLAKLRGLRHISINETRENAVLSEERVKTLSSNEQIEARFLNENPFTFMPTHKVDVTTNHKPIIKGTDEGIWRRIHLVPFEVRISDEDCDPNYREKYLMPELSGILNWMLEGFKRYNEIGLAPPDEIQDATNAYRSELDVIEQWLQDSCIRNPAYSEMIDDLYKNYAAYVDSEFKNGEGALSKRKFGDALTARGFDPKRGSGGGRLRKGLMLKNFDGVA